MYMLQLIEKKGSVWLAATTSRSTIKSATPCYVVVLLTIQV
jgi:hypothetical protein